MIDQKTTRRAFLHGATALSGTLLPLFKSSEGHAQSPSSSTTNSSHTQSLRLPDAVIAYSGLRHSIPLSQQSDVWTSKDIHVNIAPANAGKELSILLSDAATPISHLHLRWKVRSAADLRCMGDAWERSYGDLEWRGIVPDRAMPWYFMTYDGSVLRGYGVKTQPSAFCFWQLDTEGISFWADIRNGGAPLQLQRRQLNVATIITYVGQSREASFAAAREFCKCMSSSPQLPVEPLCGSNDWYYAYGKNTAEGILRDADLVARVAPASGVRPFVVVDDGWQDKQRFPDIAGLASSIRSRKLRSGIWIRPLQAPRDAKPSLLLPKARFGSQSEHASPAWDPTIPEAMELVLNTIRQPVSWGYELIKHDYSTYELLGRWGSAMGALPTDGEWQFADRSLTTAEIIIRFYKSLREAAGKNITIIGCNTIGHLGAGIFESQRIGDDTSGTTWERTRRMGINTLAFRMPQHGTFFSIDPDCVAITSDVDWYYTRQWLDLVSRSGTAFFISPEHGAIGAEQIKALEKAFALVQHSTGYAEDWFNNTAPQQWLFQSEGSQHMQYDWSGATGSFPFSV